MRCALLLVALAAPLLFAAENSVSAEDRKKLARKISVDLKDVTYAEFIQQIRSLSNTGTIIDLNVEKGLSDKVRLSYSCKEKPYDEVLDDFCRIAGLKWEIRGKVFITAHTPEK